MAERRVWQVLCNIMAAACHYRAREGGVDRVRMRNQQHGSALGHPPFAARTAAPTWVARVAPRRLLPTPLLELSLPPLPHASHLCHVQTGRAEAAQAGRRVAGVHSMAALLRAHDTGRCTGSTATAMRPTIIHCSRRLERSATAAAVPRRGLRSSAKHVNVHRRRPAAAVAALPRMMLRCRFRVPQRRDLGGWRRHGGLPPARYKPSAPCPAAGNGHALGVLPPMLV